MQGRLPHVRLQGSIGPPVAAQMPELVLMGLDILRSQRSQSPTRMMLLPDLFRNDDATLILRSRNSSTHNHQVKPRDMRKVNAILEGEVDAIEEPKGPLECPILQTHPCAFRTVNRGPWIPRAPDPKVPACELRRKEWNIFEKENKDPLLCGKLWMHPAGTAWKLKFKTASASTFFCFMCAL